MIDRLRQLAIFAKAIDHGSFRAAATELRLSPSVVSHHISQLEEQLGVALMHRSTRKLRLTSEGERLLAATHKMLEAVEGELHDLSSTSREPSGELNITAPSVLAKSHFIDRLADFLAAYPRIRCSLVFSDERRPIIEGGFDIAIRMALSAKNSATSRKLFPVRRRLVASPSYLAKHPMPAEPTDLRNWSWLELAPVRQRQIKFTTATAEQTVHRRASQVSCNDAQALYRLAVAGVGLAVIPEFLTTEDAQAGRIVFPLPDWEVEQAEVFANWPANAPRHGLIKLFVNEMSKGAAVA